MSDVGWTLTNTQFSLHYFDGQIFQELFYSEGDGADSRILADLAIIFVWS